MSNYRYRLTFDDEARAQNAIAAINNSDDFTRTEKTTPTKITTSTNYSDAKSVASALIELGIAPYGLEIAQANPLHCRITTPQLRVMCP